MAMRVSQVANRDLPSKPLRWTKALRRQSCTASSASSRFRVIRWATRKTFFAWRSQSSPKGALFPVLAAAINCSSLHSRSSLTAEALLCAESNVVIAKTDPLSNRSLQPCQDLFPQPSSLSIHSRTYAGQFSSFMPSVWHPLESSLRRDPFVFIFHSPVPIGPSRPSANLGSNFGSPWSWRMTGSVRRRINILAIRIARPTSS